MDDKAERIALLQRKHGASPETKDRIAEFNKTAKDWYGTCRKCGMELRGTLDEIRKCSCGK